MEQEAKNKQDNVDELINVYKQAGDIHREARKKLNKLIPPSKFKKLHRLALTFLDAGTKYFDEITKIAQETKGNYTEEQAKSINKLQKGWENGGIAVQNEAKRLGWEVK